MTANHEASAATPGPVLCLRFHCGTVSGVGSEGGLRATAAGTDPPAKPVQPGTSVWVEDKRPSSAPTPVGTRRCPC